MNLDGYRDLYIQSRCLLFPIFEELDVRHMNLQECDGRNLGQNMKLRYSSRQVAGRKDHVGSLLLARRIGLLPSALLIRLQIPLSNISASIDVSYFFIPSHLRISSSLLECLTPSATFHYNLLFCLLRYLIAELGFSSKWNGFMQVQIII
jgi:hypothetical protein